MKKEIHEIVITGGPCGGKTTALAVLREWLTELGYFVMVVPEVATLVIGNGFTGLETLASENPELYVRFEKEVLALQISLGKRWRKFAEMRPEPKKVILYDRGPMDVASYVTEEQFSEILKKLELKREGIRSGFRGVIHLVTAAEGAESFYTLENNSARKEKTLEEAREQDRKTIGAWIGTDHFRVIDNSTGFEEKIVRLKQAVASMLGIPEPLEIERKFLVTAADFSHPVLQNAVRVPIEQIYIVSVSENGKEKEARIRKRGPGNDAVHYYTRKKLIRPGVRIEKERIIDDREYDDFAKLRDPRTAPVHKERLCFLYENQYFELDLFETPQGLMLLEIELTEENDRVELPPFLTIEREVTDEKAYTNRSIAEQIAK